MAVSAFINATPQAPDHGDTLTVSYVVTGNDPTPPSSSVVSGQVVVGGNPLSVNTTVTLPGTPAAPVTYDVPQCDGLTFTATDDPDTFTAVVP